ncbi:unnamed protein product [Umbelopsis vinacea]
MVGQNQRTLSVLVLLFLSYFAGSVHGEAESTDPLGKKGELNPHWGIIYRNTIGSPSITLVNGPFAVGADGYISAPPIGNGALAFLIEGRPSFTDSLMWETADFGNEVDYYGKLVQDITAVGYYVFNTDVDASSGSTGTVPANLPNIAFEAIFPISGANVYTSIVWQPPSNVAPLNQWSRFIDATTEGTWYFSRDSRLSSTPSCPYATPCAFSEMLQKAILVDSTAYLISAAISKGHDFNWQGAIDGLRINNKTINFEFDGVYELLVVPKTNSNVIHAL